MKQTPMPKKAWIAIGSLAAVVLVLAAALLWLGQGRQEAQQRASALQEELDAAKETAAAGNQEVERLQEELADARTKQEEAEQRANTAEKKLEEAEDKHTGEQKAEGLIPAPGEESIFSSRDNGYVVAIDAGHTGTGYDGEQEPNGPGSSEWKARDTGGTEGVSGYPEYALNLEMALRLREELVNRGYTVYMTRESNDVKLGNIERANVANDNQADVYLRIHANSDSDSSISGALTMATSESNPYVSAELSRESQRFAQIMIDAFCEATGAYNRGVLLTDTMSGLNWSEVPCSIVEMGFMSNAAEDAAMQTAEYQEKMCQGMANGIDQYLGLSF